MSIDLSTIAGKKVIAEYRHTFDFYFRDDDHISFFIDCFVTHIDENIDTDDSPIPSIGSMRPDSTLALKQFFANKSVHTVLSEILSTNCDVYKTVFAARDKNLYFHFLPSKDNSCIAINTDAVSCIIMSE